MAAINVYLSQAEKDWVKKQKSGVARLAIQELMKRFPKGVPTEEDE